MKYLIYIILTFTFNPIVVASPDDFIITIKTNGYGESNFKQFTIPTNPSETYNYSVDCENDGIIDASEISGDYTCNYDEFGEYVIRIIHDVTTGTGFPSIQFYKNNIDVRDSDKLLSIDQWGSSQWVNMAYAFYRTHNLYVTATDTPNFLNVQDMSYMFADSKRENLDTTNWDVSNVTNMKSMFSFFPKIDINTKILDISQWDTSSVTDMSFMFSGAANIPDLDQWDISSVTNMRAMFINVTNIDNLSQWGTSSVTNMEFMFSGATNIPNLSKWDTSSVTSMKGMFSGATNIPNLSKWDTSSVTDMSFMFSSNNDKILEVPNWDTSKVITMESMFSFNTNSIVNSANWDTSSVTDMSRMFEYSGNIEISTENWDTSSVRKMDNMFYEAQDITINTITWNLSSLISMRRILKNSTNVTVNVSQWQLPVISTLDDAFNNVHMPVDQYDLFLSNLQEYSVNNNVQLDAKYSQFCSDSAENARSQLISRGWTINDAGKYCQTINSDDFIITVEGFSFNIITNSSYVYDYDVDCNNDGVLEAQSQHGDYTCDYSTMGGHGTYVIAIKHDSTTGLGFPAIQLGLSGQSKKVLLLNNWGTSRWQSMDSAFAYLSNLIPVPNDSPDFSEVTSFNQMFQNNLLLSSLDVSQWNTSSVTDMTSMFGKTRIKTLDVSNWNTELVTSMAEMFQESSISSLDVSNWNTQAVTDMSSMFQESCLTHLNVMGWNTSSVITMSYMFAEIGESIFNNCFDEGMVLDLDVSLWNTSSVRVMDGLFRFFRATSENLDVSQWDTSAVTSMNSMFSFATLSELDLSQWDTSSVVNMRSMFTNAQINNLNVNQWVTSSVRDMNNMFSTITLENLDLSQWDTSSVIDMGGMFSYTKINNINIGQWETPNVSSMNSMFKENKLPTNIYDSLLENVASQNIQQTVYFDAGDSHYCSETAVAAKDVLISTYNWIITDSGHDCSTEADFVIMVKTDNVGESTDTQFTIPINPGVNGYNYSVDCDNNGVFEAELINSSYTCNYLNAGTYKVRIVHDPLSQLGFPSMFYNNSGDVLKLLAIEQWGDGVWTNMTGAFFGANNLEIRAKDNPNFSLIIDMMDMFTGVSLPDYTYDALLIYLRDTVQTPNIGFSAGNSHYCLPQARASRRYLVEVLGWQINDNGWQCFKGYLDDYIFTVAYGVSVDINHHTPQGIGPVDYNIDCDNDGIIEHYHVQTGRSCFYQNNDYNKSKTIRIEHNLLNNEGFPYFRLNTNESLVSINQWGTGKWQSMQSLFWGASDVWVDSALPNTSEMLSTESMFKFATNIHIDVSNWDLSSVINMEGMFFLAIDLFLDTSLWDTSSVINMASLFNNSTVDVDIINWNTEKVTNMSALFRSADNVNLDISHWDISNVTNMRDIFDRVSLSSELYDDILVSFGSQNVNSNLNLDVGETQYCSLLALQARSNLIENFNWTITDGGYCDYIFKAGFEN
ncbi:MAG: BspA family leucine-rich repeat surface protein [Alcanivoracaceae bacterium]|nr:BspA family leucine-rich repeat surface protein [Alcanivoracaceae bacterium]